ncbi:MAG TPA: CHAP domain-containing protein [Candidatus Saccharimonadales bacterium]|nr:CHAP domain-containing protein [Candidatus Saccharimonadales bacterium]
MNPALILTVTGFNKKTIALVLATLAIIVALPFMALFSLGSGALSFLMGSDESDTVYAISTDVQGFYEGPEVEGDTYEWGNCTYWVYALRLKYGNPIPTTWGNADTWDDRAEADGYLVDHIPAVGAIYQTDAGKLGHVAYVSAIDPVTGDWTISEMNVRGLNIIDTRTFKAGSAIFYNFIHDKVSSNDIAN